MSSKFATELASAYVPKYVEPMDRPLGLLPYMTAAMFLSHSIHAVPPVQFSAATDYTVSGQPGEIACADFNRDGKLDLATVNSSRYAISVLFGLGGGTFQSPTNYPVGSNPWPIGVGDFDGNGLIDIVAANYGAGSISLLSGNGDGTFAPATEWSAGAQPGSIAVGDFNQDHHLDVAVANRIVRTVSVLLGNGDGTFASPITNSIPGGGLEAIVTGDFNGDGKLDLAVTSDRIGSICVLLGNGDRTFGMPSCYPATYYYSPTISLRSVAAGDFDNDGNLDLVTANHADKSSTLLKGQGNGTFLAVDTNSVGYYPRCIAVGDFNGDGNLDFVTTATGSYLALRLGTGDGSLAPPMYFSATVSPRSVTVADVNADGRPDILTAADYGNSISVFLNQSLPAIKVVPIGTQILLSWPDWAGYQLGSTTNLASPDAWSPVTNGSVVVVSGQVVLTNSIDSGQQFFRLKHF
jgi:hypothetical protein